MPLDKTKVHRLGRQDLIPAFEEYAPDNQYGARAERGTDMATHTVRLFHGLATRNKDEWRCHLRGYSRSILHHDTRTLPSY